MLNKEKLLKEIHLPEEKNLAAKIIGQAELSQKRQQMMGTDFLDPQKNAVFCDVFDKVPDLCYESFGGYEDSERRILLFYPPFLKPQEKDYPISALKISWNEKFSKAFSHRDFLGSILGLGIDRGKVGDILLEEKKAVCFVKEEIASFILLNLERVGRTKVSVTNCSLEEGAPPKKEGKLLSVTVASLRLDSLIASAFHLSRGKAQQLIEAEKVFVNWKNCTQCAAGLKEGDVLTARGFGRVILREIKGTTKKGRIGVLFEMYT